MPGDSAITVGVRMRPLVSHEKGQQHCLKVANGEVHIIPEAVEAKSAKEGPFKFDHAMDSSDEQSSTFVSNAKCYDLIGHTIVDHALDGYNSCLFCYGQTGTGKTTTILGDKQSGPGILISLFKELFEKVRQEEQNGCEIKVHVQMLEIYNEKVFDLLADEKCAQHSNHDHHKIELHVLPAGVQVKGAELKEVSNVEECLKLIDHGNSMKHIAATAMNPQSSRGHTVFKLCIHKDDSGHGIHMGSEVYFADLAGHENEKTTQVKGDRLVELSFINKSLMWLQAAIHSLAKGNGSHHKPSMSDFRNSKLTLLLSNALTGNSLVNVIVTLSPAEAHFATSLSSLKFANEVKRIKVEVTSSAQKDPAVMIKSLESEVEALKSQLAAALAGAPEPIPGAGGVENAASNGAAPDVGRESLHCGPEEFQQQLEHLEELQGELEEQEQKLREQEQQERLQQEQMVAAAAASPVRSIFDLKGPCPDPAWDPACRAGGSMRLTEDSLSDSQLAADTEALLRRVSRLGLQAGGPRPSSIERRPQSPVRQVTRPASSQSVTRPGPCGRSQSALLPQAHQVMAPRVNSSSVVIAPPVYASSVRASMSVEMPSVGTPMHGCRTPLVSGQIPSGVRSPQAARLNSGYGGGSSASLSLVPGNASPFMMSGTGSMPPSVGSLRRLPSPSKRAVRMM